MQRLTKQIVYGLFFLALIGALAAALRFLASR